VGAGQIGDLITELAAGEAGNQVDEGLALHRRDQLPVEDEPVVAARQRAPNGADLLSGKPVGVLLLRIDDDLLLRDAEGTGGWGAHVWTRLRGCAPTARTPRRARGPGEHELGAVVAGPVADQVDRGAASPA